MNIAKMIWWFGSNEQQPNDTTEDGKQIFLVMGDSNVDGRCTTIPTIAADTMYKWIDPTVTEITNQNISRDGTFGSLWPYFAEDYKAATSKKVVLVHHGYGSARFVHTTNTNDFSVDGVRYDAAINDCDSALTSLGLDVPKAIIVNCGVNDLVSTASITDIRTAIDSFFTRITTKYPNVPVLIVQNGRVGTSPTNNSQKGYQIRAYLKKMAEDYADVFIISGGLVYTGGQFGTTYWKSDGLNVHYENTLAELIGSQLSKWFVNESYSKWSRNIISSFESELSSLRKGLINDFVNNQILNANYHKFEELYLFKVPLSSDIGVDFAFKSYLFTTNTTFTANDNIATNGTNARIGRNYVNSYYNQTGAGQNDFREGVKLKERTGGTGLSYLFSRNTISSGAAIRVGQNGTKIIFNANDVTTTEGSQASLQNNTLYSVLRNGTNRQLLINKTVDVTDSTPSTGAVNDGYSIGVNHAGEKGSDTFSLWLAGKYEYGYVSVYTGFDFDSFYDDMEYLIAHWND
jgi:hypothetical protein